MIPSSQPNKKKAVYYDGSCPMCSNIMERINNSAQQGHFSLLDIKQEILPETISQRAAEEEIHVIDTDGTVYKNAEAILKILEDYPRLKLLLWLGRLPGIRQLLPFGYNFIAANRHFLFGPASRIYWLKATLVLGLLASILLSLTLWQSSRLYPLTPLVTVFPPLPVSFDVIFLAVLFSALLGALFSSKPRFFLVVTVATISVLFFLDQQRLQPWAYQYTAMLTLLALFSWKFKDAIGRETILNTSRLLIASIYFYSGLQKLNEEFIHTVFPWVIAPLAENFPFLIQQGFFSLGFFIPFIQMGIGVGLLTKKFRTLAIVLATIMCFFLLSMLGPWGHSWNSVVWPWNIALLLMVVILFAHTPRVAMQDILIIKNSIIHKIVLFVFGFLPLLYFFNLWDSYLSWSLYSGTPNSGVIVLSQEAKNNLPISLQSLTSTTDESKYLLPISGWAFTELNVPPYPETRALKNVALRVCQMTKAEEETSLILSGRLSWFNSDNPQTFSCSELRQDQ